MLIKSLTLDSPFSLGKNLSTKAFLNISQLMRHINIGLLPFVECTIFGIHLSIDIQLVWFLNGGKPHNIHYFVNVFYTLLWVFIHLEHEEHRRVHFRKVYLPWFYGTHIRIWPHILINSGCKALSLMVTAYVCTIMSWVKDRSASLISQ